jgi:tRNA U34 5-carboxymethylaminomethyl modifying GTPase MnmE/TrmE
LLDALATILPEPLGPAAASLDIGIAVGVTRARVAIESALAGDWDGGLELAAFEIREAFDSLSLVFDRVTDEELLDEVFSRFCIGK